jgi:hypothetical protein
MATVSRTIHGVRATVGELDGVAEGSRREAARQLKIVEILPGVPGPRP